MTTQDDALERDFDTVMGISGFAVPPERRAGTLMAYRQMRQFAALLHGPRPATDEPSNIFSLEPFRRG